MPSLTYDQFARLAEQGNLIPLYREILADLDTPLSAFLKLDDGGLAYLLESVEGGEHWGRYSFLGCSPAQVLRGSGARMVLEGPGDRQEVLQVPNPLEALRKVLGRYRPVTVPGLPRFSGGAVGYLSYDLVRHFEDLPHRPPEGLGLPEACLLLTDTLVVFDNRLHRMQVVANAYTEGRSLREAYEEAKDRIEALVARLRTPLPRRKPSRGRGTSLRPTSTFTQDAFQKAVLRAKEYIQAGDIFQVVLSQRFAVPLEADPLDVYRALRVVNPSPYMYFLRLGEFSLVGSSPEVLVRCEQGVVETRPIAGTRRRGETPEEDEALARELLADPKERAEHVMLVDLGRNDVGRVVRVGTVRVEEFMKVEFYSHVMHLVSTVRGALAPGVDVFDAFRACFPAGTVTGAPKIRAMEIIDELEPVDRGPYAGAVGYFSYSGNLDTCITIRTLLLTPTTAYVQAGAGIVADSVPEREYQETVNKAQGMIVALEMAQRGLE